MHLKLQEKRYDMPLMEAEFLDSTIRVVLFVRKSKKRESQVGSYRTRAMRDLM